VIKNVFAVMGDGDAYAYMCKRKVYIHLIPILYMGVLR